MIDENCSSESSSSRQRVDILGEDFLRRLSHGESPSIEEYAEKYPEIADEIREIFPALRIMDQVAPDTQDPLDERRMATADLISQIGDYQIVRKIGQGGMGVVYEARQVSLNRKVALKVLPDHIANDEKFIERFKREARAAAKLHHTNIVPVFEVGQHGDTLYYAMQFIDGQPLNDVKNEVIRLNENQSGGNSKSSISKLISGDSNSCGNSSQSNRNAYFRSIARLGVSIAEALNYAHERSIVHRDVKPSNLILDTSGVVWLADFGLAKTTDSELTETGDFLGTARYMSPERFKGQGDHRGDIYGLGVTLYELATLRPAFGSDNRLQMIEQIAKDDPPKPSEINRHFPLDLETIILKSMEKEPSRRYQSAADLADDLRRFVDDQPIRARRASTLEQTVRWMRKHKAQTVAMLSMLIAIAALVIGTMTTLEQRNLAITNEKTAKQETTRADLAAQRANQSAAVTIDAMTDLVDSVQRDMRNHPELLTLKQHVLKNAKDNLLKVSNLSGELPEVMNLKIKALTTIGRLTYEIGDYVDSRKSYVSALELADRLEHENGTTRPILKARSVCYMGLGSMAFKEHDHDQTRRYYKLAYHNDTAWCDLDPNHADANIALAQSSDNLADSYTLLNDRNWDRAEKYHKQAFDIRVRLKKSVQGNFELDFDHVASHIKRGDVYYGRANDPEATDENRKHLFSKANEWFAKSLSLCEQLMSTYPDDEVRCLRQLAAIHERLADTILGDGANRHYMKSIDIKERLAPRLSLDRNFQRDRAISWGLAALNQFNAQEHDEALESMNKCLAILQETSERIPTDSGLKIDIMITLFQLGSISDVSDRRDIWQQAIEIGDELIHEKRITSDFDFYVQIKSALNALKQTKTP